MATTHAHILYSGTVQGVGFRYTVHRIASQLDLRGWVRNLKDGRVEIRVEGPMETVVRLCCQVEERFDGYLRGKQVDWQDATGEFNDFRIAF